MKPKKVVDKKMLEETILGATYQADGLKKLNCVVAHQLSEKLDVDLSEIGEICNQMQIKISICKLGCF